MNYMHNFSNSIRIWDTNNTIFKNYRFCRFQKWYYLSTKGPKCPKQRQNDYLHKIKIKFLKTRKFLMRQLGLCCLITLTIWRLQKQIIPFLKTSGSADFKNGIICHKRCQEVWDIAKTANHTFFWDTLYKFFCWKFCLQNGIFQAFLSNLRQYFLFKGHVTFKGVRSKDQFWVQRGKGGGSNRP